MKRIIIKYLLFTNLIFIILFISSCNIANKENNTTSSMTNTETTTIPNTSTQGTSETTTTTEIINVEKKALGTWWWNKNLDIDEYLKFAVDNDVTEIYFCDYSFTDNFKELLSKANNYSIKVYLLAGEKEWLNDRDNLDELINNYINFQNNNEYKLSGIHLDIEPHQFSDFSTKRNEYLYKLIDLIKTNKELYNNINFDYDIPFWLDDLIEYNNTSKEAYKHIIDYANRVFIMSYRDDANKMYDVSKDEVKYATDNNKILFLSAETYSLEGDQVSYLEEGTTYMLNELNKLRNLIPDNFGIAIHNIKSWKELIL